MSYVWKFIRASNLTHLFIDIDPLWRERLWNGCGDNGKNAEWKNSLWKSLVVDGGFWITWKMIKLGLTKSYPGNWFHAKIMESNAAL